MARKKTMRMFGKSEMQALVNLRDRINPVLESVETDDGSILTFESYLEDTRSEHYAAYVRALEAYDQTELSADEKLDLANALSEATKCKRLRAKVLGLTPAALKKYKRFKDTPLDTILQIGEAQATWVSELDTQIQGYVDRATELDDAPLSAGVAAHMAELGVSGSPTPGGYPAIAGDVYECSFSREEKTVFVACHKWVDYDLYLRSDKADRAHDKAELVLSFKDEGIESATAFTRESAIRKLAHVYLRGWTWQGKEYKGKNGVLALCSGELPLGQVHAGGVGKTHHLVFSCGQIRTWIPLHTREAEAPVEAEAEAEAPVTRPTTRKKRTSRRKAQPKPVEAEAEELVTVEHPVEAEAEKEQA